MAKILLIDNYDSFTYNLVQAFLSLGAEVDVHRNNEIAIDEVVLLQPTHLVISPGPGRPENAFRPNPLNNISLHALVRTAESGA